MLKRISSLLVLSIVLLVFSIPSAQPTAAQSIAASVDCSSATVSEPVGIRGTLTVIVGQFIIAQVDGPIPLTATYAAQDPGTIITVFFDQTLVFQGPCSPTTGFNPGDDRVEPKPGDRIAVYCRGDHSIEVWGIDQNSQGFPLTTVTVDQIVQQGKVGVRLGSNGTVVVKVDDNGQLSVEWYGSRYGNHAKCFDCELIQRAIALRQPTKPTTNVPGTVPH
ncbi:MAG: hypothetical protein KF716_01225 [Anaerolineae bacterium]|nr:hypothetical protein [Anaerolineae bacterium]